MRKKFFAKNLSALVSLLAIWAWSNPARSAVSDCAAELCPVVYKNSGQVVFYDLSDQTKGSVTFVGGSVGYINAKDGLVIVNQHATDTALLYKVASGGSQIATLNGDTANSTVFNGYAWIPSWGGGYVFKVDPDTGNVSNILIGSGAGTWSIAANDSFAFVMNAMWASITEIDASDTQYGPYTVGVLADQFEGLIWDEDDQVLYATIANNVAKIIPGNPNYTVADYLTADLPEKPTMIDSDSTHIVVEANNYIYIITKGGTPSVLPVQVTGVDDVSLCGGYVYAANSSGVEKFDKSGTSLGTLTTDNARGVACVHPTCGNGQIDIGEQCDDSNTTPGDGCDAACQNETGPVCGNGVLETGEACDDNGTTPGDGCDAACQVETDWECDGGSPSICHLSCGDGNLDNGEECDDGAANSDTVPDACRTDCTNPTCGDDVIDSGEDCDGLNLGGETCTGLGYGGGNLSCTSCSFDPTQCVPAVTCGNGSLDTGETCDDGNTNAGDGCGANCQVETGYKCTGTGPGSCQLACGDGVLDSGTPFNEECDEGSSNSNTTPDACREDCKSPTCGDGVTDTGEQCDDENLVAGDGCDENCNIESTSCGDGVTDTDQGEECDPGDGGSILEDLNGESCVDQGFTGGQLSCTNFCRFDTSACVEEPVCDPDNNLQFLAELPDHVSLTDALRTKHTGIVNTFQTQDCQKTCFEEGGKTYIRWESSSRCIGEVNMGHYHLIMEIYRTEPGVNAVWEFDPNNMANYNHISGGRIFLHDGQNITVKYGVNGLLAATTRGTSDWAEITGVGTEDEKLVVEMHHDFEDFAVPSLGLTVTLGTDANRQGVFYLNRLADSPVWNTGEEDPKGCCQASSGPTPPPIWGVIILAIVLLNFLRRRSRANA